MARIQNETAERKLERLMVRIVLTEPFFSILLMRLKRVADSNIPTATTDGVELVYNPDWIMGLPDEHAHFILLHVVMHCVMNHNTRRGNRDPRLWNIAGDHAVNLELVSYGYTMPPGGLCNPQYKGMTAEQIYAKLRNEQQQTQPPSGGGQCPSDGQQQGDGQGEDSSPDPGGCGAVNDAPVDGPAEQAEHEAGWQQATQQAAQIAKAQGKLPGGMERLLTEILRPVVDWRDVLREFCTLNSKDDYSWSKANRRFIAQNIYLPSQVAEGCMDSFAIAVDTSGSMSATDMAAFAGEITAIMEDLKPPTVEVIYCDAAVSGRQTFTAADLPLTMKPKGGGGTSFAPVMGEINRLDDEPVCLVYFTDMYCSDFGKAPACPVLWVVTSDGDHNRVPPFGRIVHMQPATNS